MKSGGLRALLLAGVALVAALLLVLSSTGPDPDEEASNMVSRHGGVCLRLERWGLFGWSVVGHTHTITDTQQAVWRDSGEVLSCNEVPEQAYLVRLPRDGSLGVFRICGLLDDFPCVDFRRVPFDPGPPGP